MLKKIVCTATAFALTAGLALATLRPAAAGARGGPGTTGLQFLLENEADRYEITFWGGEQAVISAAGDGDIDLEVRDEAGRLVASDMAYDSTPVVVFTPPYTQRYTVRVLNSAGDAVEYVLHTN